MLEIKNLYKSYGNFNAVDGLNLNVKRGEIFGFVGPNGAGKTTTMKIICGLLSHTSGEVYVDGINVIKEGKKSKDKIGYMPDFFGVYDDLKAIEYLDFYASIYNKDLKERRKMCEELLELVDLSHKGDSYVDSLSRGMKQRLCLARSLVHNPELLVLDEPASGMDPKARVEMKEILRTLRDMGKTIIVSSHILSELAEMCTSIGIIDKGKIVIQGSFKDISDHVYGKKFIKIKLQDKIHETVMILKEFSNVDSITTSENIIQAKLDGKDEDMNKILVRLINENIPVVSFSQVDGTLEDVFMKVMRGEV